MDHPIGSRIGAARPVRASVLGTVAFGVFLVLGQPAQAQECLLDTNDDGDADTNVDTTSGATALEPGLACGNAADAGIDGTAIGAGSEAADGATAVGAGADATLRKVSQSVLEAKLSRRGALRSAQSA